jgi:sugar lactone lactonase YvrE
MKAVRWSKYLLSAAVLCGMMHSATAQVVSTVGGLGKGIVNSGDGGYVLDAKFSNIGGILSDRNGSLYITTANTVKKADAYGILNTIAGFGSSGGKSGDGGPATSAKVNGPTGLALGKDGSLYFSDTKNSCVRKIDKDGIITTVAGFGSPGFTDDTLAIHAQLNGPTSLALDESGNLYIADAGNFRLRKVSTDGKITTIAGTNSTKYPGTKIPDGLPATEVRIASIDAILPMQNGEVLFTDGYSNVVRKITTDGKAYTICGTWIARTSGDNGPAAAASLANPHGLAIDSKGNIYIGEYSGRLRVISPDGIINTVAGGGGKSSGPALEVALGPITDISVDSRDNVYISSADNIIRYFSAKTPKEDEDMVVFPNPCQSFTNVILPSGTAEIATVYALDMSGRIVSQSQGATNSYIALKFEDAGLYTIYGITKSGKWVGKVVVITP